MGEALKLLQCYGGSFPSPPPILWGGNFSYNTTAIYCGARTLITFDRASMMRRTRSVLIFLLALSLSIFYLGASKMVDECKPGQHFGPGGTCEECCDEGYACDMRQSLHPQLAHSNLYFMQHRRIHDSASISRDYDYTVGLYYDEL